MSDRPLTEKQEAFCRHLVADVQGENATKAAIAAGCSPQSARITASKWLKLPKVAARVAELKGKSEERVLKAAVTAEAYACLDNLADYVLKRLVDNVERAMQAEPVYDREGNATGFYEYEGGVANSALKLLGETRGMFKKVTETRDKTVEDFLDELDAEGAE